MKKKILFCLLLFISYSLISENSYIYNAYSGTPITIDEGHNILLQSEKISINLEDSDYTLISEYSFFNYGEQSSIKVCFPVHSHSYPISRYPMSEFYEFNIYVNGIEKDHVLGKIRGYGEYEDFHILEVSFPRAKLTRIILEYTTKNSILGLGMNSIPYIYGTGKTWNNSWNLELTISNDDEKWIHSLRIPEKISSIQNSNGKIGVEIDNVIPDEFSTEFEIWFSNEPDNIKYDYFWELSDHMVNENDLIYLSNNQLRLLRNTFFAKHGYKFNSQDLNDFFRSTNWYEPTQKFSSESFSNIEKLNIDKILEEEKRRVQ